jgi:hypothetical protein
MSEKNVLKACAGLPDGMMGDPDCSPLSAVSEKLVGKRIVSVEATNYNTIKLMLDDGLSVTLTPSGIEGDDLDISVAQQENTNAI